MRGDPKNPEFIYKKLCIYSYMFKLQSPSRSSPFPPMHLSRGFSPAQNSFWTRWFWCLLVLLPCFCFTSSTLTEHFPLRTFSSGQKNQNKKHCLGQDWVNREGGDLAVFGLKLLNSQRGVGRCVRQSPFMKWANALEESSKRIHWSWMQPLTTTPAGALIQMGS